MSIDKEFLPGCAPNGNLDTIVKIGSYYNQSKAYRYLCEKKGNKVLWTVVGKFSFGPLALLLSKTITPPRRQVLALPSFLFGMCEFIFL